ncbi:MAG TPA: murein biosynthesis integral membrane protein MurJ [Dokdonella sp.]|uniref:murein biosynthesis integral membrane protein MurJ n=1 Tax=Dokdonella sp. TaxID=2291710 RepID=UPI002D7F1095|nr:murein biosynthesis integral membrane protein MurJ [Dokdonella sp.]HET9034238.1 murein biosynthesis integral membrane protein MurJ [Dokdonella sp.]
MKAPSLLRSLLTMSGGTFVSRILGLVREMAIAWAFGASAATDAFWVAFRIPNFMRRLFAEGSFSVAFVPVLTEVKETRSHAELRELVSRTIGTLGTILLVVVALGILGAGWVTRGFAPGSIDEPAKFALTTDLLRLTFPFLLFVSLTALAGGILNSFNKFALPALTPVILNICMIAGALWLSPLLEVPIMAMGWAILAAGILQLLIQFPTLRKLDLLTLPRWGWKHAGVQKILRLMVPTLFGSSVAQVNLLLDTLIASFLITGSQTWLAQSDRLLEFPLGIFGIALGTVILPTLSRHHVSTDREGFSNALDWGLRMTLLIAVPAMIALVLLARPILFTLFQHGEFTPHDVDMASMSLSALALGLPAFALVKILAPAFYARQNTKTPVRAGIIAMVASMLLNVIFIGALLAFWQTPDSAQIGWFDRLSSVPGLHMGLALASACASYVNLALLWRALKRDGVYQARPGWFRHSARLGIACAVMTAVLWLGLEHWADWAAVSAASRVARLAALVVTGGGSFVAVMFACGFRLRDLRGQ